MVIACMRRYHPRAQTKIFLFTYFQLDNIQSEGVFVPKSPQLIVYTLEHCPNCELLKGFLKKSGLNTPSAISLLRNRSRNSG